MQLPRLKEWRLRRAMAQRDLAVASTVGLSTINRVEQGLQLARPSTVRRLAAALEIPPHELMQVPSVRRQEFETGEDDDRGH
jgi:transcriptional regulator with XRE-family HTH domain